MSVVCLCRGTLSLRYDTRLRLVFIGPVSVILGFNGSVLMLIEPVGRIQY